MNYEDKITFQTNGDEVAVKFEDMSTEGLVFQAFYNRQPKRKKMNIFAEQGHKVRYTGENAYDCDHLMLTSHGVAVGDILAVAHIDIGDWCTYVAFEGVKGTHNSVMFEDAE